METAIWNNVALKIDQSFLCTNLTGKYKYEWTICSPKEFNKFSFRFECKYLGLVKNSSGILFCSDFSSLKNFFSIQANIQLGY